MLNAAGWYAALIATVGLLLNELRHRKQTSGKALGERLQPLADAIARSDTKHSQHFAAASAAITKMAEADIKLGIVQQWQVDHEKACAERMERIEKMHKEIRDDIRELRR